MQYSRSLPFLQASDSPLHAMPLYTTSAFQPTHGTTAGLVACFSLADGRRSTLPQQLLKVLLTLCFSCSSMMQQGRTLAGRVALLPDAQDTYTYEEVRISGVWSEHLLCSSACLNSCREHSEVRGKCQLANESEREEYAFHKSGHAR